MHVIEHEERRRVEQLTEKRSHDTVQPSAPERRIEVGHLGRRFDVDIEGRCQQWRPRDELLVDGFESLREHRSGCARLLRSARHRAVTGGMDGKDSRASKPRTARIAARSAAYPGSSRAAPLRAATSRSPAPRRAPRASRSPSSPAPRKPIGRPVRARGRRRGASLPLGTVKGRAASGSNSPSTNACTSSLFPLSVSGSSSVASNDDPPRARAPPETQISSSPARAINRAASAAVSPSTVYVLRKLAPTWPVNTRPSLTPMFTGSGRPASTTARTVRSSRSSTSPNVCGAPETSTILPPSRSTSLSRNVT